MKSVHRKSLGGAMLPDSMRAIRPAMAWSLQLFAMSHWAESQHHQRIRWNGLSSSEP